VLELPAPVRLVILGRLRLRCLSRSHRCRCRRTRRPVRRPRVPRPACATICSCRPPDVPMTAGRVRRDP